MSNYIVTVIKSGNSYALRVPKRYVDDAQLSLGQKAAIGLPITQTKQDRGRIQQLLCQLQQLGPYRQIKDPIKWQREIRTDRALPGRN